MKRIPVLLLALVVCGALRAQDIDLPPAQKNGGLPLLDTLAKRATARAFDTRELPPGELSTLLWAAFGINRADGKRTAPSARNYQEVDVYVLLKQGAFVYDAAKHRLRLIVAEDLRALGGQQDFVKDAPVTLVFVANLTRMGASNAEMRRTYANLDVGYISQNVYLYCASAGFATGARAMVDRTVLGPRLKLGDEQLIVLAQSVGYAKR